MFPYTVSVSIRGESSQKGGQPGGRGGGGWRQICSSLTCDIYSRNQTTGPCQVPRRLQSKPVALYSREDNHLCVLSSCFLQCVCETDIIRDNKSCVGKRDGEDGLDNTDIWRDKGGEKQYFTDYTAAVLSEMASDSC